MISYFILFFLVVGSVIGDPNEPEFSNLEEDSRNDLLSEDAIEDQAFDLLFEELESDSERRWSFPRIARINFVPITGTSVRGSLKFYQFKDGLFIRGKLYGLAEGCFIIHFRFQKIRLVFFGSKLSNSLMIFPSVVLNFDLF